MIGRRFALLAALAIGSAPTQAFAHEFYAQYVPNRATATSTDGLEKPCITCHNNPDGGAGCVDDGGTRPCLNPFGLAFRDAAFVWGPALASLDSDGDGFTNGQELQDPTGSWNGVDASPGTAAYVTRPGFSSDSPGNTDADGDGFCWFGEDLDMNGDCLGVGENTGALDCNDDDNSVNSGEEERCEEDNDADCNGFGTLNDPVCASVVDRDGDGYCPMGRDMNRDRDCIDSGEMTGDVDCEDDSITVFPGARENCVDALDNNCDGDTDEADMMCNGDNDSDMDGYCPIGRDLNSDGDCLDPGEADAGYDCDDGDPLANPDQIEDCGDLIDNDCDGLPNFLDDECRSVFDADMDGHCPEGEDRNDDGDCADEGEDVGAFDCNDENPLISPSVAEVCTNMEDDDCDMMTSLADDDCVTHLDLDGDRYCFVGFDMNRDGDCADSGEIGGGTDCDDDNPLAAPELPEMCLNGFDDNCDGSPDGRDPVCSADYFDFDNDGYCRIGRDLDASGTCDGEGEQEGPGDEAGMDPSIFPGAPENCIDRKDNDQNGLIDMEDEACTRDVDADGDGYCPIGQDLNADGDCLDEGENLGVSDCNDNDVDRNPGSEEMCRNGGIDDDCDGEPDLFDEDCAFLLDRDGDGFCGIGIDDNGDGDCLDADEDRGGADCDDNNPLVRPRSREVCDDGLDNDCDGDVDVADSQCDCDDDSLCDDGDECTIDRCDADGEACEYVLSPMCGGDGGMTMGDAGPMVDPPDEGGCGCTTVGASQSGSAFGLFVFGALLLRRRRRR
ncbi:MAG: MopE-related protein [Polyangiales bacterium]